MIKKTNLQNFHESLDGKDNKAFKDSYYTSFFKDSSFFYKSPNENTTFEKTYMNEKNGINFLKCPKHPMFDLIMVCSEKKCNFSPLICKICLTDSHIDHRYVNIVDFLSSLEKKTQKSEKIKLKKFIKMKENVENIIDNLCLVYKEIIEKMKDFINETQAKMRSDLNIFWKSLQEYPPFKVTTIIKRIENNTINTVRVLNSSFNYLLDYENGDKKIKNDEYEKEIENAFDSILQNMSFNEDKLNKSKRAIEEIISSIKLDKIAIFHSNYTAKNDSMLRNEGVKDSIYLEDILNPQITRSLDDFDEELVKFTQKKAPKKVCFNDFKPFNSNTSSLFFAKMPLCETEKFFLSKTYSLHKAPIFDLEFLNDVVSFVSVSADHTIKIFDLRGEKLTTTLYSHSGSVNAIHYMRKNDIFATSSADSTIKLWSSKTYMLIKSFEAHEIWVQPLISLYDETILVSGGGDEKIKLWDINTGKCLNTYEHHKKGVNGLTCLDFQSGFISYSFDNWMTQWDTRQNKPILTYKNDGDFFNKVIYIPDGDIIIAGSQDGTIKTFIKANLLNILTKKAHYGACNALEYFFDGKHFASGGEDGVVKFWNYKKDFEVKETVECHKQAIQCIRYLNNSKSFLTGSVDKTIKLWEANK